MTPKQKTDLITIKYFIPAVCRNIPITPEDEKMFLENSERGLHKDKIFGHMSLWKYSGFQALLEGKRWRGIHIHELWEQGMIEGSVCYSTLCGGESPYEIPPKEVIDFMKKEMFKGTDSEIIEYYYQESLKYWNWWRKIIFKIQFYL